ncbi:unnamed protein product [Rhizophagus irregularis]|nr:unnamed protein product [Rhizophagus irregularis]
MDSFNQFHNNLIDFWNSTIDVRECEREIQCLHISIPINPNDSDENEESELIKEECIQLSDDENEENHENLIEEWIELGSLENRFENSEDEAFLSLEWNFDFNLAGQKMHPNS